MMLARMVSCARVVVVEYPGAIYHVMDRGNRQDFLKTLAEACQKTAWQVHACCLRNETTLPVKWIAARVQFGTAQGAKYLLHQLADGHHQLRLLQTGQDWLHRRDWPSGFRAKPASARACGQGEAGKRPSTADGPAWNGVPVQ